MESIGVCPLRPLTPGATCRPSTRKQTPMAKPNEKTISDAQIIKLRDTTHSKPLHVLCRIALDEGVTHRTAAQIRNAKRQLAEYLNKHEPEPKLDGPTFERHSATLRASNGDVVSMIDEASHVRIELHNGSVFDVELLAKNGAALGVRMIESAFGSAMDVEPHVSNLVYIKARRGG